MSSVSTRRGIGTLLRFVGYAFTVALALEIIVVNAQWPEAVALVSEDGPLELMHAMLAGLAALAMLGPAGARPVHGHELRVLLGLACLFAVARELDGFFRTALGAHGYQLLAAPIAAAAAWYAWRSRSVLLGHIADFAATPAAMLVFAGAVLVLVHAQVLGQKELWEALVPIGDARTVKKTVEECSELTGYFLLLFAAIEMNLAD